MDSFNEYSTACNPPTFKFDGWQADQDKAGHGMKGPIANRHPNCLRLAKQLAQRTKKAPTLSAVYHADLKGFNFVIKSLTR